MGIATRGSEDPGGMPADVTRLWSIWCFQRFHVYGIEELDVT